MMGRSSFGRGPLVGGSEPWTPLWPPSGLPADTPRMAPRRAPPSFFARPSVRMSFWVGTPHAFTTLSPSSAKTRAPPRWSPPLALASKSTHVPDSGCAPATKCARRSRALTTLPQKWCSPGSALTCISSCTRCTSTATSRIMICWLSLMDNFAPPLAPPSCGDLPDHSWQATTVVSCGGLGLRTAVGAALPVFVASRIMCRPLVTTIDTSVRPSALRANRSWVSVTRAPMRPSHALSPPSPLRSHKSRFATSTWVTHVDFLSSP